MSRYLIVGATFVVFIIMRWASGNLLGFGIFAITITGNLLINAAQRFFTVALTAIEPRPFSRIYLNEMVLFSLMLAFGIMPLVAGLKIANDAAEKCFMWYISFGALLNSAGFLRLAQTDLLALNLPSVFNHSGVIQSV